MRKLRCDWLLSLLELTQLISRGAWQLVYAPNMTWMVFLSWLLSQFSLCLILKSFPLHTSILMNPCLPPIRSPIIFSHQMQLTFLQFSSSLWFVIHFFSQRQYSLLVLLTLPPDPSAFTLFPSQSLWLFLSFYTPNLAIILLLNLFTSS